MENEPIRRYEEEELATTSPIEHTQMIRVQEDTPTELNKTPRKTTKKTRKLSKFGVLLFRILLLVAIGVAGFSGWKIYSGLKAYREGDQVYDELIYTKAGDTSKEAVEDDSIDFAALKAINPDFCGWLQLEGTKINYPVVQTTDNWYYLEHLFNRDVNHMGCIFFDYRSNKNLTDRNTAIYGHHTNSGAMFYILEEYKNQSFYDEHKQFTYKTEDATYIFEPFAGCLMDGEEAFMQLEFENDEDFMNFVQPFKDRSTFYTPLMVTPEDQIVTMSTCTDDFKNARYVLLCKVTKVSENQEAVKANLG